MVKPYKYEYDYAIVNALLRYEKLTYRQLKKIIESIAYLNRTLSDDTFNYHIKKMKTRYITQEKSDSWKRGQHVFFKLTRKTQKDIKLKILDIYYRNDQDKKSYNKMVALDRHRQEIDIEFHEKETRKMLMLMILVYQSIKISSISKRKNYTHVEGTVSVQDILCGVTSAIPFSFLNFKISRKKVLDVFHLLEKEKILKIKLIKDKIPRYITVDPNVENFIKECINVHASLIYFYFLMVWYHLRRPTSEERTYLEYYYGEKVVNNQFIKAIEKLKSNNETKSDEYLMKVFKNENENENEIYKHVFSNTIEKSKSKDELNQEHSDFTERYNEWKKDNKERKEKELKEWKEKIDALGYTSYRYVTDLEKQYSQILIKYPILKTLFRENIFPLFVRNELKKIVNKKIKINNEYVKKSYFAANVVGAYGNKYVQGTEY